MQLKDLVKRCELLILDKRLDNIAPLIKQITDLDIPIDLFIAGDGTRKVDYNHIDIQELPPRFPNSINYPTWWTRPNAYNAYLCHKKILEKAIKDNISNILLLEDDAFLEDDFEEIFNKAWNFLSNTSWDMIYFGGYHHTGSWEKTKNENVLRLKGSGGFHGVLLQKHIAEELLSFGPIGPTDWISGKFIHQLYNCYAIYPSIISQNDKQFSYVEGCELTKPSRYER